MSSHGAHERAAEPRRRRRWALAAGALVLAAGLAAYALAGTGSGAASPTAQPAASQHRPAPAPATLAPNGTFTTPSGTTATIASLRGRPTMVWFVAGGCASCAASIPAVASHLDQLTGAGLLVLTLGLYGDFPSGKTGVAQLLSFGREATVGQNVERPGWVWGMASKSLSIAYDPSGTPDLYVLIGPTGRIRYRNSVPVSTMGKLLAAAKRLDTHAQTTAAVQPCCP
jgi:hypothetical protein